MKLTIEGKQRVEGINPRALRRDGLVPAVLYGHSGAESVHLTVGAKDVENLLKQAVVNKTVVQLSVPELSWSGKTMLHEVQLHPWKGYPYHLSFFSVEAQ